MGGAPSRTKRRGRPFSCTTTAAYVASSTPGLTATFRSKCRDAEAARQESDPGQAAACNRSEGHGLAGWQKKGMGLQGKPMGSCLSANASQCFGRRGAGRNVYWCHLLSSDAAENCTLATAGNGAPNATQRCRLRRRRCWGELSAPMTCATSHTR